jgi:hypothetical protein
MTRVAGVQRVGDARSVHSLTAPRARAPPPRATRRAVKAHAGHTAEPAWTRRTLLAGTGVLGASLYLPPPPALAFDNPVDRGNGYVRYFGEVPRIPYPYPCYPCLTIAAGDAWNTH